MLAPWLRNNGKPRGIVRTCCNRQASRLCPSKLSYPLLHPTQSNQAGFDLEEVRSAAQHAQRKPRRGGRAGQAGGAGLQPRGAHAPVTQVLLVGGATRMPGLRRFVKNMTGLEAEEQAVDPDLVRRKEAG